MCSKEENLERKFILECIKMYERLPALWNIKSKDYNDRHKKNKQYEILLSKYRERYPKADKTQLLKKLNSLRTNYRKELKRFRESEKSCVDTDGAYEPRLWYFDDMKFLMNIEKSCSNDHEKKFKEKQRNTNTQQRNGTQQMTSLACNSLLEPKNEFQTISKHWASELQKLDSTQQLFAKKAINEILFEGQMGTLNRNSVKINQSTHTPTSCSNEYSPHVTYSDCSQEIEMVSQEHEIKKTIKKKRKWMKECFTKRDEFTDEKILMELQECEPNDFRHFLGLEDTTFNELLEMVTPLIEKKNTCMREPISPSMRLSITLRYLATGNSFEDLSVSSAISAQSIGKIVVETCQALIDSLNDFIQIPQNEQEWKVIADGFHQQWNFPNCLGAVDGKHVAIKKPSNSGSSFYNYKKFFSIVLMAVVNSNYEFIMVDAGINGEISDDGVLSQTNFGECLNEKTLDIPEPAALPNSKEKLPFVFVGDDAFGLSENFMTPYSQTELSFEKNIFNYRLSRAHRIAENALGILFLRFGVLQRVFALSPEKTETIVLACCYLHNYLARNQDYIMSGSVDYEDFESSSVVDGSWRDNITSTPLNACYNINSMDNGEDIRDAYSIYFSNEGQVSWQNNFVQCLDY